MESIVIKEKPIVERIEHTDSDEDDCGNYCK